jgi:hypothetical protein
MGATPSASGAIRLTNATAIKQRDPGNANDLNVIGVDGSNVCTMGDFQHCDWAVIQAKTNIGLLSGDDSGNYIWLWQHGTAHWQSGGPIVGFTSQLSPYSVHEEVVVAAPAGGTTTLAASEYAVEFVQVGTAQGQAASGSGGNVDFPIPSAGKGYRKHVYNGCTGNIVCRKAGGGGVASVTIATTKMAIVWVKSDGVYRHEADT